MLLQSDGRHDFLCSHQVDRSFHVVGQDLQAGFGTYTLPILAECRFSQLARALYLDDRFRDNQPLDVTAETQSRNYFNFRE